MDLCLSYILAPFTRFPVQERIAAMKGRSVMINEVCRNDNSFYNLLIST